MIIEAALLGKILAPIVSGIAVILLYHYVGRERLGADENKQWNKIRRTLIPPVDGIVRKRTPFALTNTTPEENRAAVVSLSSDELAHKLEDAGYVQCVLAGLKYRPSNIDPSQSTQVEYEDGSMAYRESKSDLIPDALAFRQVHVFWFDNGETLDVYAHEEYSSLNPLVAWAHYTERSASVKDGTKKLLADLRKQNVSVE